MNRKLKTLGLALVAALALTAVMASAAQANFTSDAASTTLHGVQVEPHKFTAGVGIGGVTCTTATFSGSASGTSVSTVTITPTYANCTDSLGRTVDIVDNTLEYHFLSTGSKGSVTLTGSIELKVTSAFGTCEIKISGDQTINGITYTQEGNSLKVSTHSNNITSTIAGPAFVCGTEAKHSAGGTYFGTTLMKGNGGVAKISVH